ncbi:MAG: regulator of cell morphosis and signaling [Fibrobacteres bacterium]|nr:regulator of cell morphosis and signaling [Fibrobacterota bacterium]
MDYVGERISDFCTHENLPESRLLESVSRLKSLDPVTEWNARPLYHLVDYLTENHRKFREQELPALRNLFARQAIPSTLDGYLFKLISQKYDAFEEDFLAHMEDEEEFLFPRILKTEACVAHPDLSPDLLGGSYLFFQSLHLEAPEERLKHMAALILEDIRDRVILEPVASRMSEIYTKMDNLKSELLIHAGLESKYLFPRARSLEKDLVSRLERKQPRQHF